MFGGGGGGSGVRGTFGSSVSSSSSSSSSALPPHLSNSDALDALDAGSGARRGATGERAKSALDKATHAALELAAEHSTGQAALAVKDALFNAAL